VDLLSELMETAAPGFAALSRSNAPRSTTSRPADQQPPEITEHGKRADGIVKAMLEHVDPRASGVWSI
jgi:hypothetical protein